MKIRNGFLQGIDGEIRQLILKFAEGGARIAQNRRVLQGIEGDRGDVVGHAPEVVPVGKEGLPVGGMVEVETELFGVFGPDMLGDLVDVVHEAHRIPEGEGIHILDQVGFFTAVLPQKIDLVGFIHIAHLNGFKAQKPVLDPEGSANGKQFFM